MISKFWWINFVLTITILLMMAKTIMLWQKEPLPFPSKFQEKVEKWPEPLTLKIPKPDRGAYESIAVNNLFSRQRLEKVTKPEALKKVTKASEPAPEQVANLKRQDLTLFGVIVMDDYKIAFINNLDDKNSAKQLRVKEKDRVGSYTIEKIKPEHLIVSYNRKRYKVPLFKNKKPPAEGAVARSASDDSMSSSTESPRIVNTGSKATVKKETIVGEKTEASDSRYKIINTPFGKKRILKRQ